MPFQLHPQLEKDSSPVYDLPLCEIRLYHNAAFPWLLLIPQRANCTEIIDLTASDQIQLLKEIVLTSKILKAHYSPKKLNVANLGNVVEQLHIHVIARFESDAAWPNPVWNSSVNKNYSIENKKNMIDRLHLAYCEHDGN